MANSKVVGSPVDFTTIDPKKQKPPQPFDETLFQKVIGSLQYLCLTRAEVTFSIN